GHVEDDAARVRGVGEVVEQVGEIDVEHGADRDEGAEAELLAGGPVEDGGADGAGLAEQGDRAGAGHGGGEAGVEVGRRVDDAEAVRPDQAHPAPYDVPELRFELPPLRAQFGEAPGDDDAGPGPVGDGVPEDGGDGGRGGGDHDQVHALRQGGEAGVAVDAVDGLALRVDGVDDAAEGVGEEVAEEDAADAARRGAGADDGHRA